MQAHKMKLAAIAIAALLATPAFAAPTCENTQKFDQWLATFKKDAIAQGISPQVIAAASSSLTLDESVLKRDRGQHVFSLSFIKFSDRLISQNRMQNGAKHLKEHAALFARIERDYGVPPQVLTAFWGLESDFSANFGKFNILRSLTTLAYDCRRADFFRGQLIDALRLVQRGDQRVEDMQGDWAGEFGGMQVTASDYLKNGVDYDGDGRRDIIRSTPDMLATAANFLKNLGWERGQPWLQEVRVPAEMKWEEADLNIQHPRSQWVAWGVKAANGKLPSDNMQASLLLPMGRFGPAFLAYPNFKAFLGWNSAMVYSTTVAYFATRLAGAPPVYRGSPDIVTLDADQMSELQRLLTRHGYDVGEIDGKFGTLTRTAVKQVQLKVGLPADSYPTVELIERLRGQTNGASLH
ncbi:MAG TPA: lytic murein transglycosylase [Pseudolabrys sp.]|nr:lytic murein transglycosylase [Pseudolabrys sp.]